MEGKITRAPNFAREAPTVAALITVIVIDALLRSLIEGLTTREGPNSILNPGMMRMLGMSASRLVEVLGVLAGLALLFHLTRHGAFADLGLARRRLRWLPIGFALAVAALLLAVGIVFVTGLLPIDRLLYPGPLPVLLAVAAATQAAWVEEIIFRGLLLQALGRLLDRRAAILISGAAFTLLHLFAPFTLTWAWWIVVAVAGLGLGWAFYASGGSLWITIGLHWGFDLAVFLLLGLPGETRGWIHSPALAPVPALSPTGGYVILIGAFLTALAMFLLLKMNAKREAV